MIEIGISFRFTFNFLSLLRCLFLFYFILCNYLFIYLFFFLVAMTTILSKLSKEEALRADTDNDGFISEAEFIVSRPFRCIRQRKLSFSFSFFLDIKITSAECSG